MKTLHIPCYSLKDPLPVIKKALKKLKDYKRVGLVTTSQHCNKLDTTKDFLEQNGKEVVVCGQVLGCNQRCAKSLEGGVDVFLYIGSGRFHPLGISMITNKPVFVANPYSCSVSEISDEEKSKWLKRRKGRMLKAMDSRTFGILVSTKKGQFDLTLAVEIKEKIEDSGRKAILFAGEEINPDNVIAFKVDSWINTACPRIVDDYFDKPVLNPDELEDLTQLCGITPHK